MPALHSAGIGNIMHPRPKAGRVLNTRPEAVARATYLAHLATAAIGVWLLLLGALRPNLPLVFLAVVFLGGSASLRGWLGRNGGLARCHRSLDNLFGSAPSDVSGEPADQLELLLSRRDEMESARGTPRFDPWSFLELQREIRALVRMHPNLEVQLHAVDRHES